MTPEEKDYFKILISTMERLAGYFMTKEVQALGSSSVVLEDIYDELRRLRMRIDKL